MIEHVDSYRVKFAYPCRLFLPAFVPPMPGFPGIVGGLTRVVEEEKSDEDTTQTAQ